MAVPPPPPVRWDHRELLDFLGPTHVDIVAKFAQAGLPAPSRDTVYMWRHRRAVGAESVPTVILAMLRQEKRLRNLFVVDAEEPPV